MARFELVMPKMGESIIEATILQWNKSIGDTVEVDETVLEIATDKVDSEVPSPVGGVLKEIRYQVDDVVAVGETIAIIETEGKEESEDAPEYESNRTTEPSNSEPSADENEGQQKETIASQDAKEIEVAARPSQTSRFYSPLVRNIAAEEGISIVELDQVPGTGRDGRVTKDDILSYLENRESSVSHTERPVTTATASSSPSTSVDAPVSGSVSGDDEVIEMDRMRKMIAEHMVRSKHTSPHVTSFVEVDVTNIVQWRQANKAAFQEKFGEKITYTPIFIEAVTKALRDFPGVNASVEGDKIIYKGDINVGMAAALPSGNLIVPVIKKADHLNLVGLAKEVNDLATRARNNQLKPEEIQGGTFTLTNVGTFGNVMGTPIIFQPQVAIMAAGAIRKKPAVLETEHGDVIAIRHMMFLSLSYDHRVVDGMLGGSFLAKVGSYLEAFDRNRSI